MSVNTLSSRKTPSAISGSPSSISGYESLKDSTPIFQLREYSYEQMDELHPQWDELFAASSNATTFCTWEWTFVWWKYFQDRLPEGDGKLIIVTVWRFNTLIGLIPFTYPNGAQFKMRRLRMVGDVERFEGMTDLTPLLLRTGHEREALFAILEYLSASEDPPRWDCAFVRVDDALIQRESYVRSFDDFERVIGLSQIVKLPSSWLEFRAALSKSMRDKLSYYPRRISKAGHDWRFFIARSVDDLKAALPHLIQLHSCRANSDRGTRHVNHIPTEFHAAFMEELFLLLAKKGHVWIAMIEIDGEIIAAQAFFEVDQRVQFYYSGFDGRYYDFSPLLILAACVIKEGIERGIESLDFLPDELEVNGSLSTIQEYKSRWGASSYGTISERTVYPNHLRARIIKKIRQARKSLQILSDRH